VAALAALAALAAVGGRARQALTDPRTLAGE